MKQRDQRIDLLRGIALIVILIDHIEKVTGQSLLSRLTLHHWGLCDGLDAFVFLSGCAFGIVHTRIQRQSFLPSQIKSLKRGLMLAAANWGTFLGVLALALSLQPSAMQLSRMRFAPAIDEPGTETVLAAVLGYQPFGFDILPLYVAVLCLAPGLLWLSRHTLIGALVLSLTLYVSALLFPTLWPQTADGMAWEYHPLGWQLVFFTGMLTTTAIPDKRLWVRGPTTAAICLALFLLLTISATKIIDIAAQHDVSWLTGRHIPGPIRLLHFGFVVGVFSYVATRYRSMLDNRLLGCFQLVGRHPLPVFLFGLWFTYLGAFLFSSEPWFVILLYEINGIGLSVIVAAICDYAKQSRRRDRSRH